MNLEFQAAGKPPMNELRGAKARVESSSSPQSKGYERGAQFKNLLNQSKQDIKQADQQLAKIRENRRESQSIADSNRPENEPTRSTDIDVKADGVQAEELIAEEQKSAESQANSFLPTLDHTQLIGIQNFQGGIETALTQLNLKLGLEQNKAPEGLPEQGQAITEQTDMNDQPQNVPVLESTLPFAKMANGGETEYQADNEIGQMSGDQTEVIKAAAQVQLVNGVDLTDKADLTVKVDLTDKADLTAKADLTTKADLTDEAGIITKPDDLTAKADSTKEVDITTKADLTNKLDLVAKPDLTAKAVLTDQADLTAKPDLTDEADLTAKPDLSKNSPTEQTKVIEVQKTPINQTENQNPGESGVQEISMTSVNPNKGSEVQPNTRVAVAQQVEQKILQNFEPNKPMVLQMTLSPDNLGDIDIKLSYDQGKLIIDIMAVSQETQNLLGKQINQLVRGLALQNVQVETVHLNTPVEESSDSQNTAFMMNGGSDSNQNQNQTLLRERFIKNSGALNSFLTGSDEDESILVPQNLQNYTNHKVDYFI